MLIDSHVHLNEDIFIQNIDQYIADSNKEHVNIFLCVGWDLESSIKAVTLANKYDCVWACVGIHPDNVKKMHLNDLQMIEKLLNNHKVIAIGEVGLDYFLEKNEKERQQQIKYFIKFIKMANDYNLPLVIHSRDAHAITYEILQKYPVKKKGILHCYSSGQSFVDKYIKLGFCFGIGGIITFKNAINVKESVKKIPLEYILLETDAPYLTPVPFRGKTNHSKYLPLIVKEIAMIKNVNNEDIEKITTQNFMHLFQLK